MKFNVIIIFLFLLSPIISFAEVELTQEFVDSHVSVLKSDGPYVVSELITISSGKQLDIQEGTVLSFRGGGLQVNGILNLNGTELNNIVLNLAGSSQSDVLFRVGSGKIQMNFVVVTGGSGQIIESFGGDIKIKHSHFKDIQSSGPLISTFSSSTLALEGSSFVNIQSPFVFQIFNGAMADIQKANVNNSGSQQVFSIFDSTDLFGQTRVLISDSVIDQFISNAIEVSGGAMINIRDVSFVNGGGTALYGHTQGIIEGLNLVIENNNIGLESYGSNVSISQSLFEDNKNGGVISFGGATNLPNNWWGSATGPYHHAVNPGGEGQLIIGDSTFGPWLTEKPSKNICCSSILFIPGIQGSRLYMKGLTENQLWEPNNNSDVKKLFMDSSGKSINKNIYTRDIIQKTNIVGSLFDINIYAGFINFLEELTSGGIVAGWKAVPYDWRNPTDTIATQNISLEKGKVTSMTEQIDLLVKNSKTGKVSIIAHSNGGLVAKSLIEHLSNIGKSNLIDKLILVAVPEFGAPQAIADMLYGDSQSILGGIILSKSTARDFSANLPGAYGLLPSQKYFDSVTAPVFKFVGNESKYGAEIGSKEKMDSFLTTTPSERTNQKNADSAGLLNIAQLAASNGLHNKIDYIQSQIPVTSIVGIGNQTMTGILYSYTKNKNVTSAGRTRLTSNDGDGIVLAGKSAVRSGDVYRVDLNAESLQEKENFKHVNILNARSVQKMIEGIILNDLRSLPPFVSKSATSTQNTKRYEFEIHSPVRIVAYDSEGNMTGLIKEPIGDEFGEVAEDIPGSQYVNFGEVKTVITSSPPSRIVLEGTGTGTFTFIAKEFLDEAITKQIEYKDIPVIDGMLAEFKPTMSSVLSIDYNDDAVIDQNILPTNQSGEINLTTEIEVAKRAILNQVSSRLLRDKYIGELNTVLELVNKGKLGKAAKELERNTDSFMRAMKVYNHVQKKLKIRKLVEPIVRDTTVLFYQFQRLSTIAVSLAESS